MRFPSLLLCITAAIACGGSTTTSTNTNTNPGNNNPGTTAPVVTTSVSMSSSAFNPRAIQVSPSAVVTFTNNDLLAHNATFSSGSITGTGDFTTGSRTVTMPSVVGTYAYQCTLHAGMTGTVTVQ